MQQVKVLVSLQGLGSLLWPGFSPWLETFHMPWVWPKKKKKGFSASIYSCNFSALTSLSFPSMTDNIKARSFVIDS